MNAVALWGVVEIMGRRTRAGRLSDAQLGGATLLRIEHPTRADHTGEAPLAEYYSPSAVFAIRPCSEADAKAVAGWAWPDATPRPALAPAFADRLDDDDHQCDCDDEGCPECDNRHAAELSHGGEPFWHAAELSHGGEPF